MPSPAQARYAVTDATQRNMGSASLAWRCATNGITDLRIDPQGNRPGQFPAQHIQHTNHRRLLWFASTRSAGLLFKDV